MPADEATDKADPLGDRFQAFKPRTVNIVAGFIISTLLLGGGAAAIGFPLYAAYRADWNLPFDVQKGWSWLAVGMGNFLGIILTACGVGLAIYSRNLVTHRVELRKKGFRYDWAGKVTEIFWTNVQSIRETTRYERPPLLKGPAKFLLPKMASTSFMVVASDGKEFSFTGNSIKSIEDFEKTLRELARQYALPWEHVEEHA